MFVEGLRYRKRLERNGKALSVKEQKAVDTAMQRTAAERRAERKKAGKAFSVGFTTSDMVMSARLLG